MLGDLSEVVTKLSEVSDRLKQAGKERRECIANYFLNIEKCLQNSAEQLKNGTVPSGQWAELETYGWELSSTIGKEIGEEKARDLARLLVRTASKMPTIEDISSIETIAGKFRGLANTVITKPDADNKIPRRILIYTAIGSAGLLGGLGLNNLLSLGSADEETVPQDNDSKTLEQFPRISWEMPTFLGDSVSKTILYKAPYEVCRRIEEMTYGRFSIKAKPTGDTTAILDMVSSGEVPCGYAGIYYGARRYSLFFGCAIPFGLTPQEQNAWLDYKENPNNELTFIQSIYQKLQLNVISFPAGGTGAQAGGWFNKKIESVDDFRNLKMRTIGMGGEILKKYFGVTTLDDLARGENRPNIPMDEAIERLRRGELDAVEWTGPHDDMELGLHEAAKFYHYPGWWEPSTTFDVQVNISKWNELPETYQEIFRSACRATHLSILAEYDAKNGEAFVKLKELASPQGIELVRFSNDILVFAEEKTRDFLSIYDTPNTVFGEVYGKWRGFRDQLRAWSDLNSIG